MWSLQDWALSDWSLEVCKPPSGTRIFQLSRIFKKKSFLPLSTFIKQ